jgi:hypothetical protein
MRFLTFEIQRIEEEWKRRWMQWGMEHPTALVCVHCGHPAFFPPTFGIHGLTHPIPNHEGVRHPWLWRFTRWLFGFHAFKPQVSLNTSNDL